MMWLAMLGCPLGTGAGPGPTDGPDTGIFAVDGIPVEEFLERDPVAFCQRYYRCTIPATGNARNFASEEACVEEMRAELAAFVNECTYMPVSGQLCAEEREAQAIDCAVQATGVCFGVCAL